MNSWQVVEYAVGVGRNVCDVPVRRSYLSESLSSTVLDLSS
jgi:hypothetical protein